MAHTPTLGSTLLRKFMLPRRLTVSSLAKRLGRTKHEVLELIMDVRTVDEDTANDLADVLGTTPQYWMDIQASV